MADRRYIVIEGPIGVGKTSLARRLAASLDSDLMLEEAEANLLSFSRYALAY